MDGGEQQQTRTAALARDAARARLRRFTSGAVVVAVGLSGAFAALAASSTHGKSTSARAPARSSVRQFPPLTVAPPAPLVSVEAAAPPAAVTPPASAPTPSYSPPVVSSGGS